MKRIDLTQPQPEEPGRYDLTINDWFGGRDITRQLAKEFDQEWIADRSEENERHMLMAWHWVYRGRGF